LWGAGCGRSEPGSWPPGPRRRRARAEEAAGERHRLRPGSSRGGPPASLPLLDGVQRPRLRASLSLVTVSLPQDLRILLEPVRGCTRVVKETLEDRGLWICLAVSQGGGSSRGGRGSSRGGEAGEGGPGGTGASSTEAPASPNAARGRWRRAGDEPGVSRGTVGALRTNGPQGRGGQQRKARACSWEGGRCWLRTRKGEGSGSLWGPYPRRE